MPLLMEQLEQRNSKILKFVCTHTRCIYTHTYTHTGEVIRTAVPLFHCSSVPLSKLFQLKNLFICEKSCTFAEVILTHHIMPQMIMLGSEMIRINPAKKTIEYSTSQGRSWSTRYSSSSCGEFIDLLPYGNELLAVTSKGIYYSTSQGRSWSSRYTSSSCGEFQCLMDGGRELLAQTSNGLYYSTSIGRSWSKRR